MCGPLAAGHWARPPRAGRAPGPLEPGDRAVPASAGPSGRSCGKGAGPAAGSPSNGAWPGSPRGARPGAGRAAASPGLSSSGHPGRPLPAGGAAPRPFPGRRRRQSGPRAQPGPLFPRRSAGAAGGRGGGGRSPGGAFPPGRRRGPAAGGCPWPAAASSRWPFSDQPVETAKHPSQRFCSQGLLMASPTGVPSAAGSAGLRPPAPPPLAFWVLPRPFSPLPHSLPTLLLATSLLFPSLTRARRQAHTHTHTPRCKDEKPPILFLVSLFCQ